MIHPQMVAEMLALPTKTPVAPGHPSHPTPVDPIPTVVPTPPKFEHATDAGTTMLWIVFAVMVVFSLVFVYFASTVSVSRRLVHTITTVVTVIAALSYFAMATGSGFTWHHARGHHHHDNVPDEPYPVFRQVFWVRYVDWLLTTPLLLLDLALLSGVDGAHATVGVLADVVMVLAGLFSALGRPHTGQKWGWFTIACIAYVIVIWSVGLTGARAAKARGGRVPGTFVGLAAFLFVVWTAYPIIWGVAEGARVMSVNEEIIAYAVLDILAKPVFGLWLLLSHRRVPETNVEIGGWWAHGLSTEGRIRLHDDEGA